jgi:hypothetical protein
MEGQEFRPRPESGDLPPEKAERSDAPEFDPTDPAAVFEEYFPAGEIKEVDLAELPEAARVLHKLAMMYLSPEKFDPDGFGPAKAIKHADGGQTYLASYEKDYGGASGGVEESTYLIDVDEAGDYCGYGEIRHSVSSDSEYFKDKPFVGYTRTEKGKGKKGLGLRRMAMMNAVSHMMYGQPLYSDTIQSEQAQRLWEALVKQGDAVKFKEGDHDRYVFSE